MRNALVSILMLLLPVVAFGGVLCPRVTTEHNADTSDLGRFRQFHQWKDKSGQDLALAVWKYVCGNETGLYHMNEVLDGPDPSREFSTVRDPLKLLNCYGFGLCYQDGPLLEALWEAGGFQDARTWFVTGHTVAEVFFNGKYNMFDSDMLGFTTVGQGDPRELPIASVHQLEGDKNIIMDKLLAPNVIDSSKVVFPWYPADVRARAMGGYAGIFTSKKDNWLFPFNRFPQGHSMDFLLRPGERLIRLNPRLGGGK